MTLPLPGSLRWGVSLLVRLCVGLFGCWFIHDFDSSIHQVPPFGSDKGPCAWGGDWGRGVGFFFSVKLVGCPCVSLSMLRFVGECELPYPCVSLFVNCCDCGPLFLKDLTVDLIF